MRNNNNKQRKNKQRENQMRTLLAIKAQGQLIKRRKAATKSCH